MNRRHFLELGTMSAALASGSSAATSQAGAQPSGSAGYAERDITPKIGMEQPGGYSKVYHKSLHDPCKVRAAVFQDGGTRVALVGIDALIIPRSVVVGARKEIEQRCGIPGNAVMIGASHSHSSGPVGMVLPGEYDHASPLAKKLAYEHSSAADAGYLEQVRAEIVNAVYQADKSRRASRTAFGTGTEEKAAYNRRFRMKNGLTYTHPGKGNPDIVEAAGPIDPEVAAIGTFDEKGKLIGCVVNYACHATTSPGGISANWIYYMENAIRGAFNPDAVVVFLQGFCGDVTQVDNLSPYANPSGEEWARFVGGRVGAEAVKVLLSAEAGSLGPVAVRTKLLQIPRRKPNPARLKKCIEMVQKDPKEAGMTDWVFAKEIVMLDALIAKEPRVDVEIQAIQVGPAVFVAAPGEMFCQLGLDIKAGSKFPITCPVELANGCVGYIPTEEALGKHGGGYETRLTAYSNLIPSAGTQMVNAGVELTKQLTPGKFPEPAKAPPFKEPWSYGNVPPELS